MVTVKEIGEMALRKGFQHDQEDERWLRETNRELIVISITREGDESFTVHYRQPLPTSSQKRYHGEFGPKGGARNYAARKILQLLD